MASDERKLLRGHASRGERWRFVWIKTKRLIDFVIGLADQVELQELAEEESL